MKTLNVKLAKDGFSRLFQVNGRGPWRTEYQTDCLLTNGARYDVYQDGVKVAVWVQELLCHELVSIENNFPQS